MSSLPKVDCDSRTNAVSRGWKVKLGGRWRRVVSLFRTNSSSAFSELGGHGNPNIDFAEMKVAQNAGH